MIPNIKYTKIPPKIEEVVQQLEELTAEGNSVLVFTQFLGTLDRIEKLCLKHKIKAASISGSTTKEKRIQILSEFQSSEDPRVLIMTLKTGGVGLNLTKATYVIHVDPWWNPAVENQASDRAHRLGQTQNVMIYKYIMRDSLEEKILELKNYKSQVANAILEDHSSEKSNFDLSTVEESLDEISQTKIKDPENTNGDLTLIKSSSFRLNYELFKSLLN